MIHSNERATRALATSGVSGNVLRFMALASLVAIALAASTARAQSITTGSSLWTSKCSGCHGTASTSGSQRANAADPGPNTTSTAGAAVILAAINNNAATGMGGVATTQAEREHIAAYLESVFNTTPVAASTSCNNSVVIPLAGDLELGTAATALVTFVTVTAPAHGTLSYSSVNENVTYTPGANNANDVSFVYRVRNSGNTVRTANRTVNVSIAKDNQSITFPSVIAQTYNPGGTFSLSATASSGLTVSYSSSTPTICTVSGSTVTEQGAGTCTISASQAGNLCYNAALSVQRSITINKASQTITFPDPPAQTYNPGGTFSLSATASSGLAVTYTSSTTGICTVSGSTVTEVGAGTCTINANQAGNANYNAAPQVSKNITIAKANQTITFPAQTTTSRPYALSGTFAVSPVATASSGLSVTYGTSTPAVCSASGTTITMLTAGTCTITANQAGNANYNAAGQVTQSVTITPTVPGAPTIGVGTSGDASATIAYTLNANTGGQAITSTIATCTAAGQTTRTGTDAVSPFTAITVTGLVNTVTYSCVVQADNATGRSAASGSVNVTPSQTPTPPVITSPNNTSFTVGSPDSFQVTASGFPAPTFSHTGTLPSGVTFSASGLLSGTPALGTVANYSITITAANGNAPNGTQAFQLAVVKANQTISFTPPATQLFSAATVPLTATATSGLTVSFTSLSPTVCTVTGNNVTKVAVGTCDIAANQAGNANFNAASQVLGSFDIDMGPQTITFGAQTPNTRTFSPGGTFPLSPAATSSSGLPVSYQSLTVDVCTISGTTPNVTIVSVGTCTVEAFQLGDARYTAATPVQRSIGIGKSDQTINFPAQISQSFATNGTFEISPLATATSGLPVTYNSTTISVCTVSGTTVTIVSVGACTIAANQAGDENWNAAPQVTRNVQIQAVVPGAPTIGTATPGNGQATIEFTPPAFDGGAAITSYTATCNPGNFTGNAAASPVKVLGLANGTTYSCTVTANNTAGSSPPSAPVDVTPEAIDGTALWGSVCISCHGGAPTGTQLNGGGTTSSVLEYVRANQPSMVLTPQVQALSPADLAAVAAYIASVTPPTEVTTAPNLPKAVSVAGNLTLGTISFTDIEIVTQPANGTLTPLGGTEFLYTPNNGFTGIDTFTYRGVRTSPEQVTGDVRLATINVVNGAPILTVSRSGTGQGSVSGAAAGDGIDCGTDCTEAYATGTQVTLFAVASTGSTFTGWSGGGCSGTNECTVTMDASKTVTATFTLDTFALTVQKFPINGGGTVTSNPAGINCGATCAFNFGSGTVVTLTATPLAGFQFDGWGGECAGTGTCQLSMTSARSAVAIFSAAPVTTFALTVSKTGAGSGTVTSNPAGINCGATCNANFNSGASVTLTASATAGSTFTGWSGSGCSGTGTCNVTMSAARSVTANFAVQQFALTVAKTGGGGGLVTSTPSGIDCGSTCNANFNSGVSVALGAAPTTDSFFAGWSGACTGAAACNVTMDAAKSVTAQFKLNTTIPRLANIATRMQVLTGADVLIGGFIIGGSQAKTVVVRARGPSLTAAGVPGALQNPLLQLFSGQTVIAANDDWQQAQNAATLQSSGFAPADTRESAILITLGPGAYTAIVSGVGGTTGVGIVEVFEVDLPQVPLINIATRGQVLTNADVMIGGFIIQGDAPQTVIVRARGPSLTAAGVPGALQDPVLQLFSGPNQIGINDDWQTDANAGQIQSRGFAPSDTRESAILVTLPPGAYTAIVTGKNGTTGVGIIEVFAQ